MSHQDNLPVATKTPEIDWIQRAFIIATLIGCVIALSNNDPDPDLWGHVIYGQDVINAGHLHRTATHTYTAEGYRWINHENLAELSLATCYRYVGARGMLIVKALLGLMAIWLILSSSIRKGTRPTIACCCALLTSLTLAAFWSMRPQLASFVLLTLVVYVLDKAFATWGDDRNINSRWLLFLPPLMIVWTNSHGAFVAGLCLTSAYLGVRAIELLWHRDANAAGKIAILSVIGIACWLATLANPYGLELHAWLVESLRTPRPEITEWGAPKFTDDFFWPFVALAGVTVVSLLGTKQRRDPAQMLVLLLCFWQATSHARHIALFAIFAGFWIPVHLASLLSSKKGDHDEASQKTGTPILTGEVAKDAASFPLGFLLPLLLVFGLLGVKLYKNLSDFPVARNDHPVSALQFISDQKLTGKLIVSFDWAQYALAALSPDVDVQFDGRFRTCYPQQVIDMHFDFLIGDDPDLRYRSTESGPFDPTRVLSHKSPNLVLLDRDIKHSVYVMTEMQNEFSLLYQDSVAQVWGRDSVYSDPASPSFLSSDRRWITDETQLGSVTWPAFPVAKSEIKIDGR